MSVRFWFSRQALVPAILLVIALSQARCAYAGTLTPWKGGGFGMFASLDRPTNRYLALTAFDPRGQASSVQIPVGQFRGVHVLSDAFIGEVIAYPREPNLHRIAAAVLRAQLAPPAADPHRLPSRLVQSRLSPLLAPVIAHRGALEVVGPRRTASSMSVREVHAKILRLEFEPSTGQAVLRPIGSTAIAREGPR